MAALDPVVGIRPALKKHAAYSAVIGEPLRNLGESFLCAIGQIRTLKEAWIVEDLQRGQATISINDDVSVIVPLLDDIKTISRIESVVFDTEHHVFEMRTVEPHDSLKGVCLSRDGAGTRVVEIKDQVVDLNFEFVDCHLFPPFMH